MNRKKLAAVLCVAAIGIAVAATAGAASQDVPGVTPTTITLGGTFPFTGPASLYATIPAAENAYYSWVNNHGQVHGRDINTIFYDDQYNPGLTVPKVKQLVLQDHVFAIVGSLGTAPALSTWAFLNQQNVPQALLATGDSYWGACMSTSAFVPKPYCATPKPWTTGWQPDYPSEARLYAGQILSTIANPHIGILYQNDAYGQNYKAAFRKKLGLANLPKIVKEEPYTVGDSFAVMAGHMGALKAAGADTVVLFSTPTASIRSMVAMTVALGNWKPATYLNNVSANRYFMNIAEASGANLAGVISSSYIKSQTVTPNDPGMQLAHDIIYATGNAGLEHQFDIGDNNLVYGLAVAWTAVDALRKAGADPTRGSFRNALRNLNESGGNTNPFVYPGMVVKTDPLRTYPMQQLILQAWDASVGVHDWNTFGGVLNTGK